MAKKLKVQLEVDSSKAKSQIQRDMSGIDISGGSGPSSHGPSAAAERLSKSLDGAAKKSADFGNNAEVLSAKTRAVVGAFAGMGVSMAMQHASQNMKAGAAKTAVEAASMGLQGATMGGMAGGPWGAVIGGAAGIGSALVNASQAKSRYEEGWKESEAQHNSDREFARLVKSLSAASENAEEFAQKMAKVEAELDKYRQWESKHLRSIDADIAAGKLDDADMSRGALGRTRQRMDILETIRAAMVKPGEAVKEPDTPALRVSHAAVDALARIGGDFSGGDDGFRNLQRVNEKQVALLEKIEQKTGKGQGTF